MCVFVKFIARRIDNDVSYGLFLLDLWRSHMGS